MDGFLRSTYWRNQRISRPTHRNRLICLVALDDRNLSHGLEGHFVPVYPYIEDEQVAQAIEILNRSDGPYPLPDVLKTDELEEWRKKWVYGSKFY